MYYVWLYKQFPLVIAITVGAVGIRLLVSSEPGKIIGYPEVKASMWFSSNGVDF